MTRDYQRSKVYAAEIAFEREQRAAFPALFKKWELVAEVQAFVDRVTGAKWWKGYRPPSCGEQRNLLFVPGRIKVLDGRGRRRAVAYREFGEIAIPCWARYPLIVLHELAHIMQTEWPPHGRQFVKIYLALVRRFVGGADASRLLAVYFKEKRVKTRKKG